MEKLSVPAMLEDALDTVVQTEEVLTESSWIMRTDIDAFDQICHNLPVGYLSESIGLFSQKLANHAEGKFKGEALEEICTILLNLRMSLLRTIAELTIPSQELSPLTPINVTGATPRYWQMGNAHAQQSYAIEKATNRYRLTPELFRRQRLQGTIGGLTEERNGHITSFLVRELRYDQEKPDNLLHTISMHPDIPDAGDTLLQRFLLDHLHLPLRMAVREHREDLLALLTRNGFTATGMVPAFYEVDQIPAGAILMEHKSIGPFVELSIGSKKT